MTSLPRLLSLHKVIRLVAAISCSLIPAYLRAQSADPPRPPSLKTIAVPGPSNLSEFVIDKRKAIALGKALFWDMQVGSDGVTACASCHFNAGADSRSKDQVSPGLNVVHADGSPFPDLNFDHGPNRQLSVFDFPLRQLSDPSDRGSVPLIDSNDVVSSQGVFAALFRGTVPGLPVDVVRFIRDDEGFRVGNKNVRRVEPRNTPTMINAVFNFRNFLDGRAQNEFNGVNNLGDRDPNARVFRALSETEIEPLRIRLTNASLASQAVAPPLSDREMSARGRSFPDLARKVLTARPLAQQQVHPEDSVLGDKSRWPRRGLRHETYAQMIRSAFQPQWWKSSKNLRIDGNGNVLAVDGRLHKHPGEYSLMEHNFALFFGLAIQLYEATLVADDTPYDRFMQGDTGAISEAAIRGVDLFRSQGRGRCINCHEGAELTGASVTRVSASPVRIREEQALDRGFNNIAVRPAFEDLFLGANDPFGNPLANVRRLATPPSCANGEPCPIVADGFVKVPGLRNVEITAPYFHNGGTLTLRSVLDFYSRGGDYGSIEQLDGTAIAPLNVLNNTNEEKADLEAWSLSLTDERVRHQQAPFDHPQLFVTNGHPRESTHVLRGRFGNAADSFIEIPPVGRQGDVPLKRFLEN